MSKTYDSTYLACFGACQFNHGLKSFIDLSVMDLYKDYLKIQPAEMQMLGSITSFPWCIKILYGLIADNVPICGSRRRVYICINALMSFFFLILLVPSQMMNKYIIVTFLAIIQLNGAFINVIVEALMV